MIKIIQKIKNKKGFTLIELIVVIVIIAILTAVIVPMVSRHTAQAQFATLQSNAAVISSSANVAIAGANIKDVVSNDNIIGVKKDGELTIKFGSGSASEDDHDIAYGESDANVIAVKKLWVSLNSALPADCTFFISVNSAAVEGVIYSVSGTAAEDVETVKAADGYEEGFRANDGSSGDAIGVSGIYMKNDAHGPAYNGG